jgi:prepilin-type N-terminal cleavage/methylation domain-containing protein/prepilin-type processing-associated H-X9-DG protein
MKTQPAANQTGGMTLIEVLVVIAVIAVLLLTLIPSHSPRKPIACVNNLHQIGIAFRVWEGDNDDKYPMQFALTNSQTMKLIGGGHAYVLWQTMSNELSTPKILHCPEDTGHVAATNFTSSFSDAYISYFFSLEAADTYPQMILDGDDNLAVNGVRVKPGILNLPTTNSLTWTKERHRGVGNIGMADGSVIQTTVDTLNSLVIAATNGAPFTTDRWVIP